MTRPWLLLALLVAFSGTPLRLAEAADDLARSLAGPEFEGEFEPVDGGVGDDPNESVRADVAHAPVDGPSAESWSAGFPFALPTSLHLSRSTELRLPRLPAISTRRHVLLERFLC